MGPWGSRVVVLASDTHGLGTDSDGSRVLNSDDLFPLGKGMANGEQCRKGGCEIHAA